MMNTNLSLLILIVFYYGSFVMMVASASATATGHRHQDRLFQVMLLPNGEVFDPQDYPALMAPRRGAGTPRVGGTSDQDVPHAHSNIGRRGGLSSLLTWRGDSKV